MQFDVAIQCLDIAVIIFQASQFDEKSALQNRISKRSNTFTFSNCLSRPRTGSGYSFWISLGLNGAGVLFKQYT